MAAGSRTLKLTILGDVDNLRKSLGDANSATEDSSNRMGDFGKKVGLAFAAAGAAAALYAGKLLIDGVKSAIEDEAAQAKLATTLQNVTGATNLQVAATEAYILKTSLATGVTDDELRPSLARLVRSTKDVEEAQKLQALALDIAAGGTVSLEAASNALAKAHDGNFTALNKLGGGIDADIIKSKDFEAATASLAETFGGQAAEKAETFAGKMDRLKVAIDEGKETVGSFVLDAITPMVTYFTDNVVPVIQNLAAELGDNLKPLFENLAAFFTETFIPALVQIWDYISVNLLPLFADFATFFNEVLIPAFKALWGFILDYLVPVLETILTPILQGLSAVFKKVGEFVTENEGFFKLLAAAFVVLGNAAKFLAPIIGTTLGVAFKAVGLIIDGVSLGIKGILAGINLAISAINGLIAAYNVVNNLVPGSKDLGKIPKLATGGLVTANSPYIVGEMGAELFVPTGSGRIIPNNQLGGGGSTINVTVNGAIDSEGTARQIVSILNNSFFRGTGGSGAFVTS